MDLQTHCYIGILVRLVFIAIGAIQDAESEVQYTDIDYKVFTDASRHVLEGGSPFARHTYRYTPLFAYLLVPNILIHPIFGKLLFSCIDWYITVVIYKILRIDGLSKTQSKKYAVYWLYNPLSVAISTRGNADSVSAIIVLGTILALKKKDYPVAGFLHGLAIHVRLYPIIFSLPLYLSITEGPISNIIQLLYPNKNRILFVFFTIATFLSFTYIFFILYGYEFLFESLIFHLKRTDIRHNFSVFFYIQYLSFGLEGSSLLRALGSVPVLALLVVFPLVFSQEKHLPFVEMCMAFVLVMFNSVLTCQYFIWYLCFLPLCLPHIQLGAMEMFIVASMWLLSQLTWLLPAYLLEFRAQNTFLQIWLQGLVFFFSNVMVLTALIRGYTFNSKQKST